MLLCLNIIFVIESEFNVLNKLANSLFVRLFSFVSQSYYYPDNEKMSINTYVIDIEMG